MSLLTDPIDALKLAIKAMEVARHARQDGEVFWPPEVEKIVDVARDFTSSTTPAPQIPPNLRQQVARWQRELKHDPVINAAVALFDAIRHVGIYQATNNQIGAHIVRVAADEAVRHAVGSIEECGRLSKETRAEFCAEVDRERARLSTP